MPSEPTWADVSSLSKAAFWMINSEKYSFWVKGQICLKSSWDCQSILQKRYCKFWFQLWIPFSLYPSKHWVLAIWLTLADCNRENMSHFVLTCVVWTVAEVAQLLTLSLPHVLPPQHIACSSPLLIGLRYFSFLLICSSSLHIIDVNLLSSICI